MRFKKPQMHMKYLKVGDILIDVNNQDGTIKGYGLGEITQINDESFFVKFPSRPFPVFFNQFLFRYDTAGLKGSRRTYTLDEFKKNYEYGNFDDSYLDKELLIKVKREIYI